MKITGFVLSAILALTLMASTATAGKKSDKMKRYDGKKSSMMSEGHQMNQSMMEMLKETMTILRDMNHQPSEAQKQKLDEMMGKIDGMMKMHKDRMEKKKEYMDKKMDKKMKKDKKQMKMKGDDSMDDSMDGSMDEEESTDEY